MLLGPLVILTIWKLPLRVPCWPPHNRAVSYISIRFSSCVCTYVRMYISRFRIIVNSHLTYKTQVVLVNAHSLIDCHPTFLSFSRSKDWNITCNIYFQSWSVLLQSPINHDPRRLFRHAWPPYRAIWPRAEQCAHSRGKSFCSPLASLLPSAPLGYKCKCPPRSGVNEMIL